MTVIEENPMMGRRDFLKLATPTTLGLDFLRGSALAQTKSPAIRDFVTLLTDHGQEQRPWPNNLRPYLAFDPKRDGEIKVKMLFGIFQWLNVVKPERMKQFTDIIQESGGRFVLEDGDALAIFKKAAKVAPADMTNVDAISITGDIAGVPERRVIFDYKLFSSDIVGLIPAFIHQILGVQIEGDEIRAFTYTISLLKEITDDREFAKKYPQLTSALKDKIILEEKKLANWKKFNFAMNASVPESQDALGGIDMNAANLDMIIKRDGNGVPLPVNQQDLGQMGNLGGLVPRVIEIRPASTLPLFSRIPQEQDILASRASND